MIYAGIVCLGLGALIVLIGQRKKKTQTAMMAAKAVPVSQVQPNTQVEVQGTVLCQQPLRTPNSQRECVYYEYKVEREEPQRDARGQTRAVWRTISNDSQRVPFYIQDQSGQIAVYPDQAKIDAQNFGQQDMGTVNITGGLTIGMAGYRTRSSEQALVVNGPAYIYGYATEGPNGLVLRKGTGDFIISYKTEEQMEKSIGRSAMFMKISGIVLILVGIVLVALEFTK